MTEQTITEIEKAARIIWLLEDMRAALTNDLTWALSVISRTEMPKDSKRYAEACRNIRLSQDFANRTQAILS